MNTPLKNALLAELYIATIALIPFYGEHVVGDVETIFAPMAFLSLFVLSAAVMAFLFVSVPIRKYIDGDKNQAVTFFMSTIAYFAGITALMFLIVVLVSKL